jgi:S1-C subfamily serine protease
VLVTEVTRGVIARSTNMQEGFIIQKVDGKNVNSVDELNNALQNKSGGVMVEGRYPTSDETVFYGFGM